MTSIFLQCAPTASTASTVATRVCVRTAVTATSPSVSVRVRPAGSGRCVNRSVRPDATASTACRAATVRTTRRAITWRARANAPRGTRAISARKVSESLSGDDRFLVSEILELVYMQSTTFNVLETIHSLRGPSMYGINYELIVYMLVVLICSRTE